MNVRRVLTISSIAWKEMLRRKDLYVLLILLGVLLFYLMSMDVFGLGGAIGYVKDIGLLMSWLLTWILAVTTAARQLPQEERTGTIYPLLAKPITRAELIWGKWLGVWLALLFSMVLLYAVTASVVLLRGGSFAVAPLAQGLLLHAVLLGIISAITIALSTRFNADATIALSFVISIAAFAIVPKIPTFLVHETGFSAGAMYVLYYALPHFELFDMRHRIVHDWDAATWSVVGYILLYGALWTALFLLAAQRIYKNKRFGRGGL